MVHFSANGFQIMVQDRHGNFVGAKTRKKNNGVLERLLDPGERRVAQSELRKFECDRCFAP